jgi:anaerobic magnesium-protoporphyrin IX monomethyl ester cyclase
MKMKRAIVISINLPGYYSLAIHYLKLYACLDRFLEKRCKIYTVQYDINVDDTCILRNLEKLAPDLIAFSCYVWNIQRVVPLAEKCKQLLPASRIVLGGQEVTNSTVEYLVQYPFLDIVVDGDGERTFRKILYSMVEDSFHSLKEIEGIRYRDSCGIHVAPPSEPLKDLEEVPSPYLSGSVKIPEKSVLGVMIDHVRGCPKRCTFCFEGMRCNSPRAFSIERVKEEIAWAKSRGYRHFHLLDPILGMNSPKRLEGLQRSFNQVFGDGEYKVSVEVYAENVNDTNIDYFECYHVVDIGLQTINPITNRNIKRRLNLDHFARGLELIKGRKKVTNVYLIYGLPGDDYDDFMRGICFVESLGATNVFLNRLCVLNGTGLRHDAGRFELEYERTPPYEVLSNMTYSYGDIVKSESFSKNYMRYHNKLSR